MEWKASLWEKAKSYSMRSFSAAGSSGVMVASKRATT